MTEENVPEKCPSACLGFPLFFFFFFNKFIYLFTFGCVESSLLRAGFL